MAAELSVADALSQGAKSAQELASTLGASAEGLARLIRGLASVGMFEEKDGRFSLAPGGEPLRPDAENTVKPWVLAAGRPWFRQSVDGLLESIRSGRPAFAELTGQGFYEYLPPTPTK